MPNPRTHLTRKYELCLVCRTRQTAFSGIRVQPFSDLCVQIHGWSWREHTKSIACTDLPHLRSVLAAIARRPFRVTNVPSVGMARDDR